MTGAHAFTLYAILRAELDAADAKMDELVAEASTSRNQYDEAGIMQTRQLVLTTIYLRLSQAAAVADQLRREGKRVEDLPRGTTYTVLSINGKRIDDVHDAFASIWGVGADRTTGPELLAGVLRRTVAKAIRTVLDTEPPEPAKSLALFAKDCEAGETSAAELVADLFVAACQEAQR